MTPNILVLLGCAFIPFAVAFIWFHPAVFGGKVWTDVAQLSPEQATKPVKPVKLLLSVVLNFLIAFGLYNVIIHQAGVFSLVGGDVELLKTGTAAAFLAEYGQNFLTVGHAIFHAILPAAICFVLPILGYAVIFERKSAKYLLINLGFWTISLVLMAIVIVLWGAVAA